MESFLSSLKTERTSRQRYATRDQARADVFDYIERFYNPRRRHSLLGYVSPVQFEKKTVAAQLLKSSGKSMAAQSSSITKREAISQSTLTLALPTAAGKMCGPLHQVC